MNDRQNLTIGVLTITSTILFVGVVLSTLGGRNDAMAIGQIDRGGDYVVVTGQFTENQEQVYVTDAAAQRLNVYSYDPKTRQFTLWDSVDLKAVFGSDGR